jgi:exodeoxyribonuclease VII large subunit
LSLQPKKIYTVSELTKFIKALLEEKFAFIWISGEISNFRTAASGHAYFTLKDAKAQIGAVMFRGSIRHLRQPLKDGLRVAAMGRVGVYAPRGAYQFIAEFVEAQGAGELLLAVEALKQKLASEGLFDAARKKNLPALPQCVAIVTSTSGSVIRDILQVSGRRWPGVPIEVAPVNVQGATAATEIVGALDMVVEHGCADVLIVARGGGSIEDLMAFNDEAVARAISACPIPVVSAIGHETDTTLADLVADVRAPTPSAAAELVFPAGHEARDRLAELHRRLGAILLGGVTNDRAKLYAISGRLKDPRRRIVDGRLRLDDLMFRANARMKALLAMQRRQLYWSAKRFNAIITRNLLAENNHKLEELEDKILKIIENKLEVNRKLVTHLTERLKGLSPLAILKRGYSITRALPQGETLRCSKEIDPGEAVEIQLAEGLLKATITETRDAQIGEPVSIGQQAR